jgi:hypothetical protein
VIHSLTANIEQFKHCNSLVHFFLLGANVFTLDSNEHYFPSRNRALPQDSHSLRGSARDLWTVSLIGKKRNVCRMSVGNVKEEADHLEGKGLVEGIAVLKWSVGGCVLDLSGSG